jgi:glycosyltransferase involved in cell wall biosynthesis
MRIAFLAPLKPPDHPEPSGDREVARLLVRALECGGHRVELVTRLRMLDRTGARTMDLAARACSAADAYLASVAAGPAADRPQLVFAYHVFYKAPDVAGPRIAAALGIPYVVAEGSRAPKRAGGPWDAGHRLAEAALDASALVLVLNERDREMLERARPAHQRIVSLPPFVDATAWPAVARSSGRRDGEPLRLLAVAMMRPGDKFSSYRLLAEALSLVPAAQWTLEIVGDGVARADVERLFAPFGERVFFSGRLDDRQALAQRYAGADLLVWPAVNEAFGMVFLEAALQGCPAVAGAFGGVPGVVRDGVTGTLTTPGSARSFADALTALAGDRGRLQRLSSGARAFSRGERSLESAAAHLDGLLAQLSPGRSAA